MSSSSSEFPADLVTFTEEILNGKLHFLWSVHALKDDLIRDQINDFFKTIEIIFADIVFGWQKLYYRIWGGRKSSTIEYLPLSNHQVADKSPAKPAAIVSKDMDVFLLLKYWLLYRWKGRSDYNEVPNWFSGNQPPPSMAKGSENDLKKKTCIKYPKKSTNNVQEKTGWQQYIIRKWLHLVVFSEHNILRFWDNVHLFKY